MSQPRFQAVPTERYHEVVSRQIARHIVSGAFAPGDELPSEKALMAEFGVSRAVVREALRSLHQSGMIELRQGKRTQVNEENRWNLLDPLVLIAFRDEDRVVPLLRDLAWIRGVLEPRIAAQAARIVTPSLRDELRESLARMRELLDNHEAFYLEDQRFHLLLARATGNVVLERLMNVLTRLFNVSRPPILSTSGSPGRSLEGHEEIAQRIIDGDPEGAEQAMHRHMTWRVPQLEQT